MSLLDDFIPKLRYSALMPYDPYKGTAYHYTSLGNVNAILPRVDRLVSERAGMTV